MAVFDPNEEWLGHVQPVGLVVAPVVLRAYELVPEPQTRSDTEAIKSHLSLKGSGSVLLDPWAFFADILGWRPGRVAGSPGGPSIPDDLVLRIEESEVEIAPHWAVADPEGGWQMLVRIEDEGIDPDGRGALEGWEATPHQRLERLCKDRAVRTGILVTDSELRLIYAPRGETSGWLRFPLRSLGEVGGRPMLGGLKLLLSSFRLQNDAPERRLPALLQKSRDEQAEVSTKLAAQVLGALHELMRGLHDADRERMERLAREQPEHVYDGLLTVLLRLVFLLYAEDREVIPSRTDVEARRLYDQGYGVRTLHARLMEDRGRHELTMHLRRGAWARLLALFRLVHQGDRSGEWIRGRGGKLFDSGAFPFLLGQDEPTDSPKPAEVSDECVANVLDRLLVLGGEKLSYRTLDVEQIGSVYETVMGFTVETMDGPALAIRAGKNERTPVFVDLKKLLSANDRAKFLKEEADRSKLTDRVGKALKEAGTIEELVAALTSIVDERASPGASVAAPGTPLLQPTDERRRTGSHYTPRSLTAPIVQHTLEPAFERIGPDATPEDVLSLKVCDPAMGSGAFLVEVCRALGDRLVLAWARWPQMRPAIPPDEDEPLHARRLVAQRCIYGVDRNPRAVDLAKLSLWLATLARDHEFTFLDHALKCGDSLIGLDDRQIASMHWDPSKPGLPLFRKFIADRVAELASKRAEIQSAPDDTIREVLEAKHRDVEEVAGDVRMLGNAVLSAFFAEDKPRAREKRRLEIQSWAEAFGGAKWVELLATARSLEVGHPPITPLHWEVEFPEVFRRDNPGFDAIVGNPPFAGRNTIIAGSHAQFPVWLKTIHQPSNANADLSAHFFRRVYSLIRAGGAFGMLATNTIRQGESRATALGPICSSGGEIFRAVRRLKWVGDAAVTTCVVHVLKGKTKKPRILDGRMVAYINSYLFESKDEFDPSTLVENKNLCFEGVKFDGLGFLFDEKDAESNSLLLMNELLQRDASNAKLVFPFIGGDDVLSSPTLSHSRYIINFDDMPLSRAKLSGTWRDGDSEKHQFWLRAGIVPEDYPEPVANDWPDLLKIVESKVKPFRKKKSSPKEPQNWWKYIRRGPARNRAIQDLKKVIVRPFTSTYFATFAIIPNNGYVFNKTLAVVASDSSGVFSCLSSRAHEVWMRFFGGSFEDRGQYRISSGFETFPFPTAANSNPELIDAGAIYSEFRSWLMARQNIGLTKIYSQFHEHAEIASDVLRLRELHAAMDFAVLKAYGWDDLAAQAETAFLDETNEDDHTYRNRLFWPSEFRDEVLGRLLALNAARAAGERAAGVISADEGENDEADSGEDNDA